MKRYYHGFPSCVVWIALWTTTWSMPSIAFSFQTAVNRQHHLPHQQRLRGPYHGLPTNAYNSRYDVSERVPIRTSLPISPLCHHCSHDTLSQMTRRAAGKTTTAMTTSDEEQHERQPWFRRLCSAILPKYIRIGSQFRRSLRKKVLAFAVGLLFLISTATSAFAVSGGRAGGSFGPSSSSSRMSSPYSRPSSSRLHHHSPSSSSSRSYSTYNRSRPPRPSSRRPQVQVRNHYFLPGPTLFPLGQPNYFVRYGSSPSAVVRPGGISVSDAVLVAGVVGLIAYGVSNNYKNNGGDLDSDYDSSDDSYVTRSVLGPGASMASITISMQVSNRDDPSNILHKLRILSSMANTGTREGVQDLISEVSLELLRQEKSVVSAYTYSKHFPNAYSAQRAFQRRSIESRSKFDREKVNNFGGEDRSDRSKLKPNKNLDDYFYTVNNPKATNVVVTINLAIEGDSTILPVIRTRKDFVSALSKVAADAQVEDCLVAAEVLWAPEDRWEVMTPNDIYADYPNLVPL